MVNGTRAEPGCIEYSFAFDALDDHLLRIFEVFVDDAALAAHRASAHMASWRTLMPERMGCPASPTFKLVSPFCTFSLRAAWLSEIRMRGSSLASLTA